VAPGRRGRGGPGGGGSRATCPVRACGGPTSSRPSSSSSWPSSPPCSSGARGRRSWPRGSAAAGDGRGAAVGARPRQRGPVLRAVRLRRGAGQRRPGRIDRPPTPHHRDGPGLRSPSPARGRVGWGPLRKRPPPSGSSLHNLPSAPPPVRGRTTSPARGEGPWTSVFVHGDAADVPALQHVLVALVDLVQAVPPGDELVQLQVARPVQAAALVFIARPPGPAAAAGPRSP
jgi:hypothetical protein